MPLLCDSEMMLPNARESLASLQDGPIVILFHFENVLCVHDHDCVGAHMYAGMRYVCTHTCGPEGSLLSNTVHLSFETGPVIGLGLAG